MDLITLDFESYFDDQYTLRKLTTEEYIRDERFQAFGCGVKLNSDPARWVKEEDLQDFFKRAKQKIESSAVIMHHGHFDGLILSHHYGIRPKKILCTLSMARPVVSPLVSKSLDSLLKHFKIGQKLGGGEILNRVKGKRKLSFMEMSELARYCCDDVEGAYKLFHELARGFPKQELRIIDMTVRAFTEPVLELDVPLLEGYIRHIRANKRIHLIAAGVDEKTVMSNPQFAEALRKLGVEPPTKFNEKGIETYAFAKTDEGLQMLLEHEDERVQSLVAARLKNKSTINETRAERFISMASRGKACVYYNYYGADKTGRHSGGDKSNYQNMTRGSELRRSVKAPKGYAIAAADSNAIESRFVDWLALQEDSIERWRNNEDQYSYIATEVYGYEVNKHDHPNERFTGKTIKLGCGYGMGDKKFYSTCRQKGINITEKMAAVSVATYRRRFNKVAELWELAHESIPHMIAGIERAIDPRGLFHTVKEGIMLPNGFTIKFPNLRVVAGSRGKEYVYDRKRKNAVLPDKLYGGKIIENVVQAACRIIIMDQSLEVNLRWPVKLSTHDEIGAVPRIEEADECLEFMIRTMRTPPQWCADLPLNAEGGYADNYGDIEK